MLADALGRPLRIMLTGGEVHDSKTALALLEDVDAQGVIADKAYDSNEISQRDYRRGHGYRHPLQALPENPNSPRCEPLQNQKPNRTLL